MNLNGPLIVGFGHRQRVGKDTLAGLLRTRLAEYGLNAYRDAFAWRLKDIARKVFGYAGLGPIDLYEKSPELRDTILPALGMTPRQVWITFGNSMRKMASDVWIRGVLDNVAYSSASIVLVSDVRYPNEVDAIKERGGLLVKVTRSSIAESDDEADMALAGMPDSEWDFIIRNDGGMAALGDLADELAKEIACPRNGKGI